MLLIRNNGKDSTSFSHHPGLKNNGPSGKKNRTFNCQGGGGGGNEKKKNAAEIYGACGNQNKFNISGWGQKKGRKQKST